MVALTKTERRIYRALQERPRSADELRDAAWWDHPQGRPECEKTIYVHISNLRKRLNRYGLTVERGGADDWTLRYRIKYFPGNLPAWKEFDPDAVWVAG
jgi:hypothetical protein